MGERKQKTDLGREALLQCKPLMKEVYLSELSGSVWVRVMSGQEHRKFRDIIINDEEKDADGNPASIVPTLVALTAVDEHGQNLFTLLDREAIDKLPSTIQNKIFRESMLLNGLTGKSIEDHEKN